MPKETYYFSHDYNARNDRKIAALVKDYKSSGYGIFWAACEMMHEEGGYLEFDMLTVESIAKDLNEEPSFIKEVLEKCTDKYRLFLKQTEAVLEANEAEILLHSGRVKRNLADRTKTKQKKIEAGRLGGIKSGESRRNDNKIDELPKQNEAMLQAERSSEPNKGNKGNILIVDNSENQIVGSEKVRIAANEAWKDGFWIDSTSKAHQISTKDLEQWMHQYNASVSNDPINGFNAAKYKKMFGGWLNTQISKGYKLPTKKNDMGQLKTIQ